MIAATCIHSSTSAAAPLEPPALDDAAMERELAELSAQLDAAAHRQVTLIRMIDESGRWARQGAKTCAHWLSWRINMDLGAARERLRVGHALVELPAIDEAFRTARLSYSQVRALTRVATRENEARLLELAECSTASQLERICRGVRQAVRADADDVGVDGAIERWVRLRPMGDGTTRLEAQLMADEAARVMDAIRSVRASMRGGDAVPTMADALVRLVEEWAGGQTGASEAASARCADDDAPHDDAPHDGAPHDGAPHDDAPHDDPPHDGALHDDAPHGDALDGISPHSEPHSEALHGDVLHGDALHDGAPHDGAPHDDPPHGDPPHDGAPHDGALHGDAPHDDPPHDDAPHDDAPHDDAPHDDAPHDYAPHDGAPHDDAPHDDAPHDDPPHDDAPRDDAPHDDPPHDDAPRDYAPHDGALHGDALHDGALHGDALHDGALHGNALDEAPLDEAPLDEAPLDEAALHEAAEKDARSAAARQANSRPRTGGDLGTLFLHLAPDVLERGHAVTLDDGTRLDAETFRRIACDCGLVPVQIDEEGEPLDVGRKTRAIPPALRRAITIRDAGCCTFPGCNHTRYLHGHHVEHWFDGGATRKDNLLLLCSFHHRLVHEGGWTVRFDGSDRPRFVRPDGAPHPHTFPRKGIDLSDALDALEGRHGDLAIDEETARSGWGGERPDMAMCVEAAMPREVLDGPATTWLAEQGYGGGS